MCYNNILDWMRFSAHFDDQPRTPYSLKSFACPSSPGYALHFKVCVGNSFGIPLLHALSFSVSRKSFTCHSYENNRGVYQLFPFWNLRLNTSAYLFSFHILPNSFALSKISTLLFSSKSKLFCKNTRVGVGSASFTTNWLSSAPSDKIPSPPTNCEHRRWAIEDIA
jgi:hypothetical protein